VKGRDDRISGPQPLAGSAARRVEAIIEGAEQAAGRVIDDAEAKARAYLAEAEAEADRLVEERLASLGELIDALVAQADAIRRQAELLAQSLREAKDKLESEVGGGTAEAPAASPPSGPAATEPGAPASVPAEAGPAHGEEPRTPHLSAVEPVEPPARPVPPPAGEAGTGPGPRGRGTPAGARLLATQMAVSGSSRQEIATRLRNGFEIEDADAILDAILGPEA
jgi:vacuolar-type H+-ATPase subunit H